MTAETPSGKLHPIAKWSLIIGPVLVVVFNFLLPTNGFDPINPEDSRTFIAELGADAGIVQIYLVLILVGIILYTRGIIGLYQVTAAGGAARQRMGIGMLGAVAAPGEAFPAAPTSLHVAGHRFAAVAQGVAAGAEE